MAQYPLNYIFKTSSGNEYQLIRYLGEGLTAEVYLATRIVVKDSPQAFPVNSQVAIKVLKTGLPSDIVLSFQAEADILQELAHYENKIGQNNVVRLVEAVIGANNPQQLLALEFIKGKPITKWLEEQGVLPEQDALLIAQKVLQVLKILHEQIRRTYTDFQLQNIWWQPESKTIKILDWNHVSYRVKEGESLSLEQVRPDLARLGAYLYQMTTGKGAWQLGETRIQLQNRAKDKWQTLSLGTRQIIARVLAPNPDSRFHSAQKMLDHIEAQQTRWDMPFHELAEEMVAAMRPIKQAINQGKAAKLEEIELASSLTDLCLHRQPEDRQAQESRQILNQLTKEISAKWGIGWQYYQSGSFQEAAIHWEHEAQNIGQLPLWRWFLLAQSGTEGDKAVFDSVRPKLEKVLTLTQSEEWTDAKATLDQIRSDYSTPSLQNLLQEIQAQLHTQQAKKHESLGEWKAATDYYQRILKIVETITPLAYRALLEEEHAWGKTYLQEQIEKCHQQEQKQAEDFALKEKLDNLKDDFEKLNKEVQAQLQIAPSNTTLLKFIQEKIADPPTPRSQQLVWLNIILFWGQLTASETEKLHQKRREIQEQNFRDQFQQLFSAEKWQALSSLIQQYQLPLPQSILDQLHQKFEEVSQLGWLPSMEEVAQLLLLADPNFKGTEQIQQLRDLRLKEREDSFEALPGQIVRLLEAKELEKAQKLLTQVKQFFADQPERITTIERLQAFVQPEVSVEENINQARQYLAKQPIQVEKIRSFCQQAKELMPTTNGDQSQWLLAIQEIENQAQTLNNLEQFDQHIGAASFYLNQLSPRFEQAKQEYEQAKSLIDQLPADKKEKLKEDLKNIEQKIQMGKARALEIPSKNEWPSQLRTQLFALVLGFSMLAVLIVLFAYQTRKELGTLSGLQGTSVATIQGWFDTQKVEIVTLQEMSNLQGAEVATIQNAVGSQGTQIAAVATMVTTPTPSPTPSPTPTPTPLPPLEMAVQFLSPVSADSATYFDLPNMELTAPANWSFDLSADHLQLKDEVGNPIPLQLVYQPDGGVEVVQLVPSDWVTSTTSSAITVTWTVFITETHVANPTLLTPLPSGHYTAWWRISQDEQFRETLHPPFTVISPPLLNITLSCRTQPQWNPNFNIDTPKVVEAIGKKLVPFNHENNNKRHGEEDYFLLVRLAGTHQTCWVGDQHMQEFDSVETNTWLGILAQLPELP